MSTVAAAVVALAGVVASVRFVGCFERPIDVRYVFLVHSAIAAYEVYANAVVCPHPNSSIHCHRRKMVRCRSVTAANVLLDVELACVCYRSHCYRRRKNSLATDNRKSIDRLHVKRPQRKHLELNLNRDAAGMARTVHVQVNFAAHAAAAAAPRCCHVYRHFSILPYSAPPVEMKEKYWLF